MRRQMDASPAAKITQTGWNAYSRIDAVEGIDRSELARLFIDSDAWTGIREWDGQIDHAKDLKDSYRALPFRLVPNAETLIIGPGGGPDVVAARVRRAQGYCRRDEPVDAEVCSALRAPSCKPLRPS